MLPTILIHNPKTNKPNMLLGALARKTPLLLLYSPEAPTEADFNMDRSGDARLRCNPSYTRGDRQPSDAQAERGEGITRPSGFK